MVQAVALAWWEIFDEARWVFGWCVGGVFGGASSDFGAEAGVDALSVADHRTELAPTRGRQLGPVAEGRSAATPHREVGH